MINRKSSKLVLILKGTANRSRFFTFPAYICSMTFDVKTIGIAGAGSMGSGIAQVCTQAGFQVVLYDISSEMLTKAEKGIAAGFQFLVSKAKLTSEEQEAALGRITFSNQISSLKADLIIEAVIEKLEVKHQFFTEVAAINPPTTILASNTSSIPITQIAAKIPNPDRFLGIHFFNPAPVMKLVEIIKGESTSDEVSDFCFDLISGMGKTCVIAKDAPGFIVNRVARHYYVEGLKLLEENVASLEDIDGLMENFGFKMGPFRLMDLIGVDTNLSVTKSMYQLFHFDSKFRPNRIQQQKVDAGKFGRKSGEGFYRYE